MNMLFNRFVISSLLVIACTLQLHAQSDNWRSVLPRDTVVARLRAHVLALASDSMAGRRPPSPGNAMAAAYVAREFDRLELESVRRGDRSPVRFYEHFSFLHGVEAGPANAVVITSNEAGSHRVVTLRADGSRITPMGFSESGRVSGPLVFVGYGITDSASGYDDYAGIDARGSIALIMRYSPEGDKTHGRFGSAMGWAAKVRNAIRSGARGIIFIDRPGISSDATPAFGFQRGFLNAGLPAMFVRSELFSEEGLTALSRRIADARRLIDSTATPHSFAIGGLDVTLMTDVQRLETSVPNVVALMPGIDPKLKDEVIVIGAHFDHLGDGGEGSLHSGHDRAIHYGADDNASGTAGLLVLAEEMARRRDNRRTIMFAGFNAEEEGLIGSQALLRTVQLPDGLKMVAMINLDMIGRLDSLKLQVHGTGTSPGFEPMLDSLNPGLVLRYSKAGVGPSDHASFYAKGVPVLAFFTGVHMDYHKPTDTPEKVNYDGQAAIVGLVRDVVGTIDRADTAPAFTKADAPAGMRSRAAFKVYIGTLPDYSYDGKGMRITGTSGGSPAEAAGLREGDVIVRIGDFPIANIYDYMDALARLSVGQAVQPTLVRAGKEVTVTIVMRAP